MQQQPNKSSADKMLRIMEIMWLVIAIIGLFMFIYSSLYSDRREAIYFLVFTLVSAVMHLVRKRQRKIRTTDKKS